MVNLTIIKTLCRVSRKSVKFVTHTQNVSEDRNGLTPVKKQTKQDQKLLTRDQRNAVFLKMSPAITTIPASKLLKKKT